MKKRLIYARILAQQNLKKASIIIGPRQVGKTIIMKQLHQKLGGLFFDVDVFSDYEKILNYERLIATLEANGYKKNQESLFFVFIDEFQRYPNLSLVIKSIYDHHENIKIYATGSSSLEIKNSIQESLAGRKIITHMYPFDFEEFLYFKNREDLIEQITRIPNLKTDDYFIHLPEAYELLKEFLVFGGYPAVAISKTKEEKIEELKSIFDLYIKKDFAEYIKIEKLRNASQLMRILAINNGQGANYAKYAGVSEINIETVKNYISILKETFIINTLHPYYTNKNKEISKMPKIYFMDNGVRNYFSGGFADLESRSDIGFLFEGFYVSQFIKKGIEPDLIKYYRSKNGEEIDIILDRQPFLVPIELKFKKKTNARDLSVIKRFVLKNKLPAGFIVSVGELKKIDQIELIDCFRSL